MLASASLFQQQGPLEMSPTVSRLASMKPPATANASSGHSGPSKASPAFHDLIQELAAFHALIPQLAAQHDREVQQLQSRLDHVHAENRALKSRADRASSLRRSEQITEPRLADSLSEGSAPHSPRNFDIQSLSDGNSVTLGVESISTTEVALAVPLERTIGLVPPTPSPLPPPIMSRLSERSEGEDCDEGGEDNPRNEVTRTSERLPAFDRDDSTSQNKKSIVIHEVWTKPSFGSRKGTTKAFGQRLTPDRANSVDELTFVGMTRGIMRYFIGNPTSPSRMAWDGLGGIMILYDIITLPLMVFEDFDGPVNAVLDWMVLVYWTLNVFNSLTCGYLENGVAIMSPKAILLKYLSRTIFVDLLTLVPDWIVTMMQLFASGQGFQEARLLRALRAFRLTRLVRIVKLRWLMEVVRDYLDSEYASVMFEIAKMMALLLVINHGLACAWYGLALLSSEIGWRSWKSVTILDYGQTSWFYHYLTCLHWSLCQFTPASMSVQPTNPLERGFAASTVLFALIVFSYIVGSITGSLTQLRMMSEAITRETLKLRRFLRRNAVPIGLSLRIRRFVEFELKRRQQPISQASVGCLNVLSDQLQSELGFSLVQPTLATHPLFEMLMRSTGGCDLLEKAAQGFEKKTLALDDWEFLADTPATHMRYLVSGELRYAKQTGVCLAESEEMDLQPGDNYWISEAVLWVKEWEYVGELTANLESNLLLISPECMLPWVLMYPASHKHLKTYASDFAKLQRNLPGEELTDVIDPQVLNHLVHNSGRRKISAQLFR